MLDQFWVNPKTVLSGGENEALGNLLPSHWLKCIVTDHGFISSLLYSSLAQPTTYTDLTLTLTVIQFFKGGSGRVVYGAACERK